MNLFFNYFYLDNLLYEQSKMKRSSAHNLKAVAATMCPQNKVRQAGFYDKQVLHHVCMTTMWRNPVNLGLNVNKSWAKNL